MMKQTLGKVLFVLLFLTFPGFAGVEVSVSSPTIYKGEGVDFVISADGGDIAFPQIDEISGFSVLGTSSSQSVNILNGAMTQTTSKTYRFSPDKPITIPSFEVKVDGKVIQTKELKIDVLKPTASQNGSPFVVEIKLDKHEAYVGEAVDLSLSFKQKFDAHADKLQLAEPKLANFWIKKVDKVEQSNKGDYIVQTLHYQLFPQKSGTFVIPAVEAVIGQVDRSRGRGVFDDPFFRSFGAMAQRLAWNKIYSNEANLTVLALPNALELYGAYHIQASVDKTEVHANKPVNLTIAIKGEGNIDDIKKFTLEIDNTIVYADEPKITSQMMGGLYQGEFTQKIAIIADQNFTIPALSLEYFDKATKQVKTIKTEAIPIRVVGAEGGATKPSSIEVSPSNTITATKPQIESNTTQSQTNTATHTKESSANYLFLLIGFILGVGLTYGYHRLQNRVVTTQSDIVKAIHKAKTDRALFDLLLPYAKKDPVISDALNKLEENLYRNSKHTINKEAVMEIFEEV